MTIKQGTILPVTGIGTGYLLVFIYVIVGWNIGFNTLLRVPAAYILILIPALMQFSYKDFILSDDEPGYYYYRYRILFLIHIKQKLSFTTYHSVVIRVIRKSYRVQQGAGPGVSIAEGKHNEEYLALVGYTNPIDKIEICKGKKQELDFIIRTHISPLGIPVYLGAPKKGYEYVPQE